jgi:hypothetical protein
VNQFQSFRSSRFAESIKGLASSINGIAHDERDPAEITCMQRVMLFQDAISKGGTIVVAVVSDFWIPHKPPFRWAGATMHGLRIQFA